MEYPNCRNWRAQVVQENIAGGTWTLSVSGEVEVSASDPAYALYFRDAQGTRFRLQLDTVRMEGDAAEAQGQAEPATTSWQKLGYKQPGLAAPTYDNIMVLYSDFIVGTCDVQVIHSIAGSAGAEPAQDEGGPPAASAD